VEIRLATTPDPVRVGMNQVEVSLERDARPVADARVELRSQLDPLAGRNPMEAVEAAPAGPGRYRGTVRLGQPGPWQVTVLVKRPGQPDAEANYTFNVGADATVSIAGQVRIRADLGQRVKPGAALFLIARRGAGPPVAARRIADPAFPLAFTLGPADAIMGVAFEGEFELVARIKMDGTAGPPQPGDIEGKAAGPVRVGARDVVIELDRAL
jgi:cytochrome c-type biogenesis protein CcmH